MSRALPAPLPLLSLLLAFLLTAPFVARGAEPEGAYDVKIVAPGNLDEILRDSLDIVRWRTYPDVSPELLDRLAREAEKQAYEAVATQGYFSPKIDVGVEDAQGRRTVRIVVEPGEPTRVKEVRLTFRGAVVEESNEARMEAVREGWSLPDGAIFRQADWDAAKRRALDTLAAERYADTVVASSRATIDPDTRRATLELELDSGPPFFFGPVSVTGLGRFPEEIVRNLVPFLPGDPYSREQMEVLQRRLTGTSYFASAQIVLETDRARAGEAPVRVSVIEAPTRRLELGVGYSTDTLYRFTASWRNVDVRNEAWRVRSEARIESKVQRLTGVLDLPARANGWGDSFDAAVEHSDIQNLETHTAVVGYRYRRLAERNQLAFGVQAFWEQQQPADFPQETVHALYAFADQTWRVTDDLLSPRSGVVLNVQAGAGVPGASSQGFGRAVAGVAGFVPLARGNDLTFRAEAGAVLASTSSGIPQALLFRTGGDTTVRGYAYQSLGVDQGSAVVGGRYYTLASAEYIRWIGESWGLATFIDAGDAADSISALRIAVGYGAGIRIRSPIGPFRLDVAYGVRTQEFRIHFSVGLAF